MIAVIGSLALFESENKLIIGLLLISTIIAFVLMIVGAFWKNETKELQKKKLEKEIALRERIEKKLMEEEEEKKKLQEQEEKARVDVYNWLYINSYWDSSEGRECYTTEEIVDGVNLTPEKVEKICSEHEGIKRCESYQLGGVRAFSFKNMWKIDSDYASKHKDGGYITKPDWGWP